MVIRISPLTRNAGLLLAACGTLTAMEHPGLSAPGRNRPAAPRARKAPVRVAETVVQGVGTPRPSLPAVPPPGDQIMPASEVRPGMKGYGLTVFRGTTIERFEVEVVGVMPKSNMGQPLVLVRLSGGPISRRGAYLIQGMSGSPIYVNGKLLGAFSMGDAWPKEPLGMVTPIQDMMEALDPKLSQVPAGEAAALPSTGTPDFASADGAGAPGLFGSPLDPAPVNAAGGSFRPLAIPVSVTGLSSRNLDRVAQVLRPFNLSVLQGPGSMGQPLKTELVPGAAVGVALLSGDIDITGIGTVTYRKGNEVLAFGHPMMQIGPAQFPLTTAYIHDVFPGFQVSHKIGSAGEMVGTLT